MISRIWAHVYVWSWYCCLPPAVESDKPSRYLPPSVGVYVHM